MTIAFARPFTRKAFAFAAAATTFGCAPAPASSPSPTAPMASRTAPPASPSIVGTVLVSSTEKAPPSGGVVYLEAAPIQPGVATTAQIDVYHKEFSPLISVITAGGTVTFGNKDALAHHVFSPDIPKWDTGYLQKNATVAKTFDAPGPIALLCNIHPEMVGYLVVIPSSYFGKLGANGAYVIVDVPAGTYRATAWAPHMQTSSQSVTVTPGAAVTANFELRPAAAAN